MRRFLDFKPWELFLITVTPIATGRIFNLSESFTFSLGLISLLIFLCWTFSIVFYGQKIIDNLNLKRYNFALFTIATILIPVLIVVNRIIKKDYIHQVGLTDIVYLVNAILILLSLLVVLYIAVKTIINIEKRRNTAFDEWFGYLLLMIAFVFGIWIIQTKVNQQIGKKCK